MLRPVWHQCYQLILQYISNALQAVFGETIEAGRPLDSLQMQMLYQPNAVKANESNGV